VMFQDLPPVKGHNVQMEGAPAPAVIPLRLVIEEVSRPTDAAQGRPERVEGRSE
jgi:hypothetical protein